MKKEWSAGKIVGLILGIIAAVIILWIALLASLFQLVDFLNRIEENSAEGYEEFYDYKNDADEKTDDYDDDYDDEYEYDYDYDDNYNFDTDEKYYDFANDIRNDLLYQVSFENYKKDDFVSESGGSAVIDFEYPVISGDAPNPDGINQTIYEEVNAVEEHINAFMGYLSGEDEYKYTGTCYVTYMSEEILSLACVEYGYLNGEVLESYVISMNFDMQTGMKLSNVNLVETDDSFSIDFRERCEKQNGEINALSYMSDQEITEYLTDNDSLIIFYTPLGMEIGFNYYEGWVTVTYKDYEKFKKQF